MFKDVVNGLHPSHLNAARKVLNLEPQPEEPEDTTSYTQEQKTKDLSAFMAYSASLAFLAYTKPHEITPHRRFGIKESLTDGATIQHVRKDALKECMRKILRFRVKKCLIEIDNEDGISFSTSMTDPYVVLTHGKSMAKCRVLEDISQAEENSYHYLFVRTNTSGNINGFIAYKDTGELATGQNERLGAFVRYPDSDGFELDPSNAAPGIHTRTLTANSGEINITVHFSYEVRSAEHFSREPSIYGNCLWLDDYSIKKFGTRGSNWHASLKILGIKTRSVFPMAYIDLGSTLTQAWFYWNEAEKVLVLAFPGTETIEEMAEDAATGNNAATEKLGDIASEVSHPKLEVDIENSTSKVHKGYKDAYLSIRDILLDIVYSVTKWSKDWLIIVTGHSDGGSIAALAAYDIATKKNSDPTRENYRPKLAMFTFAAPGLSDEDMAEKFSESVPFGFRIAARNDQVANMMCSHLQRLGKVIPCDGRPYRSIQDILDATSEDVRCTSNLRTRGNLNVTVLNEETESMSIQIGRITPKLVRLHGVENYFTVIQEFLSVLYP